MKIFTAAFSILLANSAFAAPIYDCIILRESFVDNNGHTEVTRKLLASFDLENEPFSVVLERTPTHFYGARCSFEKSSCEGPVEHLWCGILDIEIPHGRTDSEILAELDADRACRNTAGIFRPFPQVRTHMNSGFLRFNYLKTPTVSDTIECIPKPE